jgi:hypothetical protein
MLNTTIEIIGGRERRRRWSVEEKLRIVAETHESGASVRAVHSLGIDLVMPPDFPAALADEAAPHAVAIGELLRLQAADEPRRVSPHQGRG